MRIETSKEKRGLRDLGIRCIWPRKGEKDSQHTRTYILYMLFTFAPPERRKGLVIKLMKRKDSRDTNKWPKPLQIPLYHTHTNIHHVFETAGDVFFFFLVSLFGDPGNDYCDVSAFPVPDLSLTVRQKGGRIIAEVRERGTK
jgi:hypothetical protein